MKQIKNKAQKLTPVYSILYKLTVDGLSHNYGSHGLGKDIKTPTYSAKKAISIAKNLESEGKLVKVYQYGWKQRGFRSNEEACKIIYISQNFWEKKK